MKIMWHPASKRTFLRKEGCPGLEMLKNSFYHDIFFNFFAEFSSGDKKTLKKVWYVNYLSYLCGVFEA